MRLARDLHKTRAELYTGQATPLSSAEFTDWLAFYALDAEDLERAARRK